MLMDLEREFKESVMESVLGRDFLTVPHILLNAGAEHRET